MSGRRLAAGGLAALLATVVVCVVLVSGGGGGDRRSVLAQTPPESFAQWYQSQSAAAWFGDSKMPRRVQVGNQVFSEPEQKGKWLTRRDLKGIPAVLETEHKRKLKSEAVELAMARLASKKKDEGLARALRQKLAGAGDIASLKRLASAAPEAEQKPFNSQASLVSPEPPRTRRVLPKLFQVLDQYRPAETEADGADLPENRIFGAIEALDKNLMNRTTSSFADALSHHAPPSAADIAKEEAAEEERRRAEAEAEQAMVTAGSSLQDMLNKQMALKAEQAETLSQLTSTLNDVLDPKGYTSADITQCGDHCAEVQVATAAQDGGAKKAEAGGVSAVPL